MSGVFADTAFFAAITNRRDEFHRRAKDLAATIERPIVTTEFVLVESANFCTTGRRRATYVRLVENLRRAGNVEIVPAMAADFQGGLDLFGRRPDKDWSLTDCISFVVMQDRGLTDALTTDRHFEQAGFTVLLT